MPLFIMLIPHTPFQTSHSSPVIYDRSRLLITSSPLPRTSYPKPTTSPFTANLSPSHLSPSPRQQNLTAHPKATKHLIEQHARRSRRSPSSRKKSVKKHTLDSSPAHSPILARFGDDPTSSGTAFSSLKQVLLSVFSPAISSSRAKIERCKS